MCEYFICTSLELHVCEVYFGALICEDLVNFTLFIKGLSDHFLYEVRGVVKNGYFTVRLAERVVVVVVA